MTSLSFEDALLYAVQGRAILFIGAGFSTLFKILNLVLYPLAVDSLQRWWISAMVSRQKDREMHGIAKMGHILFLPAHRLGRLWKFKKDDVRRMGESGWSR